MPERTGEWDLRGGTVQAGFKMGYIAKEEENGDLWRVFCLCLCEYD